MDEGDDGKIHLYSFQILAPNDKLVVNAECSLRYDGGEHLIRITEMERDAVTISCGNKIGLNQEPYLLVIYPWFLYEKLRDALSDLLKSDDIYLDSAGKASQLSLFEPVASDRIRDWDLAPIFAKGRFHRILGLTIVAQRQLISGRRNRLERLSVLYDEKMQFLTDKLRSREKDIVSDPL